MSWLPIILTSLFVVRSSNIVFHNFSPANVNILDGCAADLQAECDAYEEKIRKVCLAVHYMLCMILFFYCTMLSLINVYLFFTGGRS